MEYGMLDGGKGREGECEWVCWGGGGGKSIWGVGEKIRKRMVGNIVLLGMVEYWGSRGGWFYVVMLYCNGR